MSDQNLAAIVGKIRESGARKVKVAVSDVDGILRGKYMHIDKLTSAAEKGFGFCTVVFGWDCDDNLYDSSPYTGWFNGYPDAHVRLDAASFRQIPWENDLPFFLGSFVDEKTGEAIEVCPRGRLAHIDTQVKQAGYELKVGCEYEWFNFRETAQSLAEKGYRNPEPLTPGMFGYSLIRSGANRHYFNDLMDSLETFGVPLEGLHTETGPGVYEAAIQACGILEAADRAILFKSAVKDIASDHGIVPSFMARWNTELPGSSGHIHQSLCDDSGRNLFADASDPDGMSDLFRSYLAGLIRYLPEITALVAPTINSYKRLVEGYWAPTRVNWGLDNRTCALRVITGGSATRVEVRVPGADMNPYLATAACAAAGFRGVDEGLKLEQAAVRGNGYEDRDSAPFPGSLQEACVRLRASDFARESFGNLFVDHYAATREWEVREFAKSVTNWEMKRYFEIV